MIKFFIPDVRFRSNEPELMDNPQCDKIRLINTIKQFTIINKLFSASRRIITDHIINDIVSSGKKEAALLDIGAGGCDIPIWVVQRCRKLGIRISVTCVDYDKTITDYAKSVCSDYPEIEIVNSDIFEIDADKRWDYTFTSNFMHHFTTEDVTKLLNLTMRVTSKRVVLSDIRRSIPAYIGYTLFTGIFLHRSFAFYDGRLSILKGFRENELTAAIKDSCFKDKMELVRYNPARLVLIGVCD